MKKLNKFILTYLLFMLIGLLSIGLLALIGCVFYLHNPILVGAFVLALSCIIPALTECAGGK